MRFANITPPTLPGGQAAQPFILGDDSIARGPGSRFIVAGWPAWKQITQSIPYLYNPYAVNFAWGNREVAFSLVCEYEFADESDCFLFNCTLPQVCPAYGALLMGIVGGGGGTVFYPNATIARVVPIIGAAEGQVVTTRIRYDIEAGAPSISKANNEG